jgi:hypothetical protein
MSDSKIYLKIGFVAGSLKTGKSRQPRMDFKIFLIQ